MTNFSNNAKRWLNGLSFGAMLFCVSTLVSCSSSDEVTGGGSGSETDSTSTTFDSQNVVYNQGGYFISARSPQGTEYVIQVKEIEGKQLYLNKNQMELPTVHYTWLFNGKTAIGMSYQQDQPGLGYAFRANNGAQFTQFGQFQINNRFTNYDFFDSSTFITSVGGQVSSDNSRNDGATFEFWVINDNGIARRNEKTIWTENITGTDEQITFSSIVKLSDDQFLTAIVRSSYQERGSSTGGSSVGDVKYPDSMWVARMDTALNVIKVYGDDRLSYAAGQYRAQMFREVLKTNDGTIYIFSNAFNSKTTKKAGALKFDTANDRIDPDYYWDIQGAANGYKFRRVWYMTGHKFLLEIYNDYTVSIQGVGHQFAIVDMQEKKLTWLSGIPAKSSIISGSESGGVPMFHNGYIYLPITKLTEDAGIYKVDVNTGKATKITIITGAEEVRSIGYIE